MIRYALITLLALAAFTSCGAPREGGPRSEPYRIKLHVAPGVRPPALYVRDQAGRVAYSWAEHSSMPRLMVAEGNPDWTVQVADGDQLFIEVEGARVTYVHNGRAAFESQTPFDPARNYTFELYVYGQTGEPAVYSGPLRSPSSAAPH